MNWQLFFSTFALIFVAELPDKTALAVVVMAARNRASAIFAGAASAFFLQCIVAVFFGKLFSYLPERVVHLASGFLFLIFAILALRRENDEDANGTNRRPRSFIEAYRLAFIAVFIAEWGDLTQLATVTLVARTQEIWTIFLSSLAALWSATAIGCYAGHHLGRRIPLRPLQILSAALFAVVGVWMIVSA